MTGDAPDPFNERLQGMTDGETAEWSCRSMIRSLLQPSKSETPEVRAALDYARRTLKAGTDGLLRQISGIASEEERIDAFGDIELILEGALWIATSVPAQEVEKLLRRSPGRPKKVDDNAVRDEVFRLMDHHGDFVAGDPEWNAQARLVEAIEEKFSLSPSRAKVRIEKPLQEWRRLKSGL